MSLIYVAFVQYAKVMCVCVCVHQFAILSPHLKTSSRLLCSLLEKWGGKHCMLSKCWTRLSFLYQPRKCGRQLMITRRSINWISCTFIRFIIKWHCHSCYWLFWFDSEWQVIKTVSLNMSLCWTNFRMNKLREQTKVQQLVSVSVYVSVCVWRHLSQINTLCTRLFFFVCVFLAHFYSYMHILLFGRVFVFIFLLSDIIRPMLISFCLFVTAVDFFFVPFLW